MRHIFGKLISLEILHLTVWKVMPYRESSSISVGLVHLFKSLGEVSVGHRCCSTAHRNLDQNRCLLYSFLPFQFFHQAFWRILVGFQRCACWKANAEHQYQQHFFHFKNTYTDPAFSFHPTSCFCPTEDILAFDSASVCWTWDGNQHPRTSRGNLTAHRLSLG